jgi:hypothetical protein
MTPIYKIYCEDQFQNSHLISELKNFCMQSIYIDFTRGQLKHFLFLKLATEIIKPHF